MNDETITSINVAYATTWEVFGKGEQRFNRWVTLYTAADEGILVGIDVMQLCAEPGGPITETDGLGIAVNFMDDTTDVLNGFLSDPLHRGQGTETTTVQERARVLAARARTLAELLLPAADALEEIANRETR
jgi:hypothetical protein